MHYNGLAYYIPRCEPLGQNSHKSPSVTTEQRRKIPRMVRMRAAARVIVHTGILKALARAGSALMDMEGKESAFAAFRAAARQPVHAHGNNTASPVRVEIHISDKAAVFFAPVEPGICHRSSE